MPNDRCWKVCKRERGARGVIQLPCRGGGGKGGWEENIGGGCIQKNQYPYYEKGFVFILRGGIRVYTTPGMGWSGETITQPPPSSQPAVAGAICSLNGQLLR